MDFHYLLFTESSRTVPKFWLLHMNGDIGNTGLAGFNNRLQSVRFSTASQLQSGT
jgi:hypothetical protein